MKCYYHYYHHSECRLCATRAVPLARKRVAMLALPTSATTATILAVVFVRMGKNFRADQKSVVLFTLYLLQVISVSRCFPVAFASLYRGYPCVLTMCAHTVCPEYVLTAFAFRVCSFVRLTVRSHACPQCLLLPFALCACALNLLSMCAFNVSCQRALSCEPRTCAPSVCFQGPLNTPKTEIDFRPCLHTFFFPSIMVSKVQGSDCMLLGVYRWGKLLKTSPFLEFLIYHQLHFETTLDYWCLGCLLPFLLITSIPWGRLKITLIHQTDSSRTNPGTNVSSPATFTCTCITFIPRDAGNNCRIECTREPSGCRQTSLV